MTINNRKQPARAERFYSQKPACNNCYFFDQTSEKHNSEGGVKKIGYCRYNPPTVHHEIEDGVLTPKIGRFPIVLGNMWCGAWESTADQTAEATK